MCGENQAGASGQVLIRGSSPRVRGKRYLGPALPAARGLIPACAGKTLVEGPQRPRLRAHPRVCGENSRSMRTSGTPSGSSPRVRGKRERHPVAGHRRRLIPACAGKIATPSPTLAAVRAHPRVCGENGSWALGSTFADGSSPRVRGKYALGGDRTLDRGLIPACAGKIYSPALERIMSPAHPRVCGENSRRASSTAAGFGSSPRVRGKPERRPGGDGGGGLIPACAGKTRSTH